MVSGYLCDTGHILVRGVSSTTSVAITITWAIKTTWVMILIYGFAQTITRQGKDGLRYF